MDIRMIQRAWEGYLECALWSSVDDSGEPLDRDYDAACIDDEAQIQMFAELVDFIRANWDHCNAVTGIPYSWASVGHDFWLTRNHHGAGFWDRGLGEIGDALTDAAYAYGERDLYVGDDGKLYVS